MELYIVIAAKQAINEQGQTVLIYDDSTEKFILDKEELAKGELAASIVYLNYLQEKFQVKDPSFSVVRQKIAIESEIDVVTLKSQDAISKLSPAEFNSLKETILNGTV